MGSNPVQALTDSLFENFLFVATQLSYVDKYDCL